MLGFLLFGILLAGCDMNVIDTTAPGAPLGVITLSLDNAVQVDWYPNSERDIAGYRVWISNEYDGRYTLLGTVRTNRFVDYAARNGITYYYAVSAYDFDGNESPLSYEEAHATPRPEGYNVRLYDYRLFPSSSGYDFSTYSVGPYNDDFTDVFFEVFNGVFYLNVWDDSDIQDMGYTGSFDDITRAPVSGWSPSGYVEAIVGHTYVVWTWDDHYAKLRIRNITSTSVVFDWAYQTSTGNPQLKRGTLPGTRSIGKQPVPIK
ncbi:MAG: hypothetical protein WD295_06625 [Bacteroidota bacterium]